MLSEAVQWPIERVRSALRLWSLADGLALVIMGIVGLFWGSFALDYLVEPGLRFRCLLLVLLVASLLFLIGRYFVSRLRAPIADRSIALLMERTFPELGDRLVTAVELEKQSAGYSPALLQSTVREAESALARLPIGKVLRRDRVCRKLGVALLLMATVGGAALATPALMSTWLERVIQLGNVRYPRRTLVRVLGFDGLGAKVARGRDFELLAEADATMVIPDKMQVRYWMGKATNESYLTQVGDNRFRYVFKNVLEPVDFEVRGGDDRTDVYRIEVVEPPSLTAIGIRARFPSYTGLPVRELQYRGASVSFVKGTRVTLSIATNKPIHEIEFRQGDRVLPVLRSSERSFQTELDLNENDPITVHLKDEDGIQPEPFLIHVSALEDRPPIVEADLEGVGRAITPLARLPFRVRVGDDFGVRSAAFRLKVDAGERPDQPIPTEGQDPLAIEGLFAIEAESLALEPMGKLSVHVTASDANPLPTAESSQSNEFVFEIITPEEFLSRISTRELNLRQRFEQVIRELRETHDRMQDFVGQLSMGLPADRAVPRLHAERALQELRKNSNETAGIAQAFRGILDELRNNRAGTSTLHDRLEQGILLPLEGFLAREIVDGDHRLQELRVAIETLTDGESAANAEAARASLQLILFRADEILKSMLKLESFNEAVAILRSIIADQNQLLEKTRSERKKQVLDLLK